MADTKVRSVVKTISWRITGSLSTLIISYVVLGSLTIASSIAIVQLIANTMLYFIHERAWARINWGLDD